MGLKQATGYAGGHDWVNHAISNPRDINLKYLTEKSFLRKLKTHSWCEERKIRNTIEFYNFTNKIRAEEKARRTL
jgi:hypothetical protein